jgi:hypothetical protein
MDTHLSLSALPDAAVFLSRITMIEERWNSLPEKRSLETTETNFAA